MKCQNWGCSDNGAGRCERTTVCIDRIVHKPDSTTAGPSGRASGCSPLGVEQPLDLTRFTAGPVARPMDSKSDKGGVQCITSNPNEPDYIGDPIDYER